MKKKFKIGFNFFISFLILLSSILSGNTASAVDNNSTEKYVGWTVKESNYDEAIYVSKESDNTVGDTLKAIVAYCFNFTYATPPYVEKDKANSQKPTVPTYTKHTATGELFNELATSERVSGDDLVQKITKVVYNGYPNNAGNLKGTLSDGRFRAVTQYAVWYFTDQTMSIERPETKLTTDEKELFDKLIGEKEGAEEVPNNVTLNIYKNTKAVKASTATNAAKPEYQNLLSADIVDKTTGQKITVTPKEKVEVFAKKDWQNLPASGGKVDVEFTLYKNGKKVDFKDKDQNPKKILATSTDSTVSWKNLDGQLKDYTIKEEKVPDNFEASAVSGDGSAKNPFVITNTYKNKAGVEISVTKKWSGENIPTDKPEVYFELLKFGQASERKKLEGDKVTWSNINQEDLPFITVAEVTEKGYPWKADNYKAGKVQKISSTQYEVTNEYLAPKPKTQKVKFSKVDVGGKEIAGAKIEIKQADKVVNTWTSEENKTHELDLAPGNYTFHEEAAPTGYLKVTDITFNVAENGEVKITSKSDDDSAEVKESNKLVVVDQAEVVQKVLVSKVNIAGEEIEGAKIKITQGDKEIATWTSEEGKTKELELLPGSYTFHEETSPLGYFKVTDINFTVDNKGQIKVTNKGEKDKVVAEGNKLTITDEKAGNDVEFSKVNLGGKEIAGAKIQIHVGGVTIKEWTSEEGKTKKLVLTKGSYIFHEEAAPNGYEKVTDITFDVDENGKVTVTGANDNKVEAKDNKLVVTDYNETYKVKFSKKALTENGEELKGATIEVQDKDGKVVETWLSDGSVKEFNLKAGNYKFVEKAAPAGYTLATAIEFSVDKDGTIKVGDKKVESDAPIVMVDGYATQKVLISKVNLGGEEIAGAKIQIKQGDEVKTEWTSEKDKTKEINLLPGEYIFHEEAAPEGYLVVTDIKFSVDKDGKVEIKEAKEDEAKLEGEKLVVTDKAAPKEEPKPEEPKEEEKPKPEEPKEEEKPKPEEPKEEEKPKPETPKEEEKPKPETPKEEEKPKPETPKEEEKPKPETPKEEEKPKPETPKEEEKPKPEEPKEEEKPKPEEPKEEEKPKPEEPKEEEKPKPETPKEEEKPKPETPKEEEKPKPEEPKEEEKPKPETPKEEEKPKPETPKEEEKPKPETPKEEEKPKPETPKEEEKPKPETPKEEEKPKPETPKEEEKPKPETPKEEEKPKPEEPKEEEKPKPETPKEEEKPKPETPKEEEKPKPETPKEEEKPKPETPKDEHPKQEQPKDEEKPKSETETKTKEGQKLPLTQTTTTNMSIFAILLAIFSSVAYRRKK